MSDATNISTPDVQSAAGRLIDALQAAGGTIVVENGKVMLRGAKIPEELKAALRAAKPAVIAEWDRRNVQSKDRYAEVPAGEVALAARELGSIGAELVTAVALYVIRQPKPVHAWWNARSLEYHALGFLPEECDWRAAVDVLAWQRNAPAVKAVEWLATIEESAAEFKKSAGASARPPREQQPGLL